MDGFGIRSGANSLTRAAATMASLTRVLRYFTSAFALVAMNSCVSPNFRSTPKYDLSLRDGKILDVDPHRVLTANEVKSDLDILDFALHNAYVGSATLPSGEFGFLERKIADAREGKNLSAVQLCLNLQKIFDGVHDGHLHASLQKKACGGVAEPRSATPDALAAKLTGEKSKPPLAWALSERKTPRGLCAILTIHWFPAKEASDWNGFTTAIAHAMRSQSLVIDLRNNDGGDDTRGLELSAKLFDAASPEPDASVINLRTVEALTILRNNLLRVGVNAAAAGGDGKQFVPYIETLNRKIVEVRHHPEPRLEKEIFPAGATAAGKNAYRHDIFVLVNHKTFSSGESTALSLRGLPRVRLVGQNTAGLIHFGNVGIFQLPQSGIAITMGTHFVESRDGSFLEKVGLTPDLKVPENEDALEWLVKRELI